MFGQLITKESLTSEEVEEQLTNTPLTSKQIISILGVKMTPATLIAIIKRKVRDYTTQGVAATHRYVLSAIGVQQLMSAVQSPSTENKTKTHTAKTHKVIVENGISYTSISIELSVTRDEWAYLTRIHRHLFSKKVGNLAWHIKLEQKQEFIKALGERRESKKTALSYGIKKSHAFIG